MLERLSALVMEQNCLKRRLGMSFDNNERNLLFAKLTVIEKEIKDLKFKIRLQKEIKNEKSR